MMKGYVWLRRLFYIAALFVDLPSFRAEFARDSPTGATDEVLFSKNSDEEAIITSLVEKCKQIKEYTVRNDCR